MKKDQLRKYSQISTSIYKYQHFLTFSTIPAMQSKIEMEYRTIQPAYSMSEWIGALEQDKSYKEIPGSENNLIAQWTN